MERSKQCKIKEFISEEQIYNDLKRYRDAALEEKGVTGATILGRDDIFVDLRASLKCYIPKCWGYGRSASCPPHTLKPEETQKLVNCYHHAIFLKVDMTPEVVTGPVTKAIVTGEIDPEGRAAGISRSTINVIKAVSKVEALAFYEGYHLAMGFSAGTCRVTLCYKSKDCAVLKGERCRNIYLSRPSMEAVGFDVFRMATRVGWDVYPVGCNTNPDEITHGSVFGLVLVT